MSIFVFNIVTPFEPNQIFCEQVIKYLYTGTIDFNENIIQELLFVGDMYLFEDLIEICNDLLKIEEISNDLIKIEEESKKNKLEENEFVENITIFGNDDPDY